jgi:hypothetical protein
MIRVDGERSNVDADTGLVLYFESLTECGILESTAQNRHLYL